MYIINTYLIYEQIKNIIHLFLTICNCSIINEQLITKRTKYQTIKKDETTKHTEVISTSTLDESKSSIPACLNKVLACSLSPRPNISTASSENKHIFQNHH